jgi:glutathione peroxidase
MGIFGNKKEDENDVRWNFTKFIVNRKGEVVERFEPTTSMSDVETHVKNLVENEK